MKELHTFPYRQYPDYSFNAVTLSIIDIPNRIKAYIM